MNQQVQLNTNILSRFKVFEEKHHLNRRVYRNRGVLKDAERFSLVDTALDGEYNDIEIIEIRKISAKQKFLALTRKSGKHLEFLRRKVAAGVFLVFLTVVLSVYYLFHIRYKAK